MSMRWQLLLEGEFGWRSFALVLLGCLIAVIVFSGLAARTLKENRRGKRKGKNSTK
jgi:hypothetical protein